MIRYSVIIPQRDCGDALRRQLPALANAMTPLGQPFEAIVVDDGSASSTLRLLEKLLGDYHWLRSIRLDWPVGTSLALAAGIQAARGETVIALAAGEHYPTAQIPWLIDWLQRADLVVGRRRCRVWEKLWKRVTRIPRWALLGLESHDPDCLFWAARREAIDNISLETGMARYLPAFVVRRGYRVCEAYVEHVGLPQGLSDVRPNPFDLLVAWWRCRRWKEVRSEEMTSASASVPVLKLVGDERSSAGTASSSIYSQAKSA